MSKKRVIFITLVLFMTVAPLKITKSMKNNQCEVVFNVKISNKKRESLSKIILRKSETLS